MPSGKQLSFINGEVSPSLRFRTDLASYSEGLSKLHNAYVRKTGGVSNRAGTRYLKQANFQNNISPLSGIPGVKLFGYVNKYGNPYIVEVTSPLVGDEPSKRTRRVKVHHLFSGTVLDVVADQAGNSSYPFVSSANLNSARMVVIENQLIIQYGDGNLLVIDHDPESVDANTMFVHGFLSPTRVEDGLGASPAPGIAIDIQCFGLAPQDLRVSYLIMQELYDGTEHPWTGRAFTKCHPHANNTAFISAPIYLSPKIKRYNIYRASSGIESIAPFTNPDQRVLEGEGGHYSLVARIPGNNRGQPEGPYTVLIQDFITEPDVTVQPPISKILYGNFYGVVIVGGPPPVFPEDVVTPAVSPSTGAQRQIQTAKLIDFYQQRKMIIHAEVDPKGLTTGFKEGTIVASKIGAHGMLDTPFTANKIDAFEFTIPVSNTSPIIAVLSMERFIVFTESHVFIIRGSEEGILTNSTINPYIVSEEGCSKYIAPKAAGKKGYYINSGHDKLMAIQFGADNEVAVQEISTISDHFLADKNVLAMEVVKGAEDIVWLLKKDGTLISVTVTSQLEVTGWASHSIDGVIEDITSLNRLSDLKLPDFSPYELAGKIGLNYNSLVVSVIRDEVRHIEMLSHRIDNDPQRYSFADSHKVFGRRSFFVSSTADYENSLLNIEGGITWAAGETLTVKNIASAEVHHPATAFNAGTLDTRIDFIYDVEVKNSEGKQELVQRKLRFVPTVVVAVDELQGYFDEDVPLYLQDVEAAAPSNKTAIQSRWLPAVNKVTGLTHLEGREVSVYADNQVLASPLNDNYEKITVPVSGEIDLPDYFNYGVVGLPYSSEIETLDLDTSDERTFTDSMKLVNSVGVAFHESRGGFAGQTGSGDDLANMNEFINREQELVEQNTKNINGHIAIAIPAHWEKTGRILIKQVDPMPMTVLAVYPKGVAGG